MTATLTAAVAAVITKKMIHITHIRYDSMMCVRLLMSKSAEQAYFIPLPSCSCSMCVYVSFIFSIYFDFHISRSLKHTLTHTHFLTMNSLNANIMFAI